VLEFEKKKREPEVNRVPLKTGTETDNHR